MMHTDYPKVAYTAWKTLVKAIDCNCTHILINLNKDQDYKMGVVPSRDSMVNTKFMHIEIITLISRIPFSGYLTPVTRVIPHKLWR